MSIYNWVKSPASYQCWTNINYAQAKLTEYRKYHTKHIYPELLANFQISMYFKILTDSRKDYSICRTEESNEALIQSKQTTKCLLQPVSSNGQCAMLLISNLVQPQWVSVDCKEKLINHVVCFDANTTNEYSVTDLLNSKLCKKSQILFKVTCYNFLRFRPKVHNPFGMCPKTSKIITSFSLYNNLYIKPLFRMISKSINLNEISFVFIDKTERFVQLFVSKKTWMELLNIKHQK